MEIWREGLPSAKLFIIFTYQLAYNPFQQHLITNAKRNDFMKVLIFENLGILWIFLFNWLQYHRKNIYESDSVERGTFNLM